MANADDGRLVDYFLHRRIWLIDTNRQPAKPQPYFCSPQYEQPDDSRPPDFPQTSRPG
jgi:hypothetical protein